MRHRMRPFVSGAAMFRGAMRNLRTDAHFPIGENGQTAPSAVAKGFAPVSASAALWASDPTGAATTAGPRLTATASEIGWRIDGGKGPFQGGGEYLRMVDRTRVS